MIIDGTFYNSGLTKKDTDKIIQGIKSATKKACKSKKSALKFLVDAGIIKKHEK